MTKNERDCLAFIRKFHADTDYMPTLVEIAIGLGLSPKSKGIVSYRVNALIREGALVRHGRHLGFPDSTHRRAVALLKRVAPGTEPNATTSEIIDQLDAAFTNIMRRGQFSINAA